MRLLFLSLLLLPLGLLSQLETNIGGFWEGKLTQNEGGFVSDVVFDISMQLRQNGIFIKGTAYVRYRNIYAEMELSGHQLPNGSWKLTETKILRSEQPDDILWCLKGYELRISYNKTGILFSGPWWGSTVQSVCTPGSVTLHRKQKRV